MEKLKEEQSRLKGKLVELMRFMNSEEFFKLSPNKRQVYVNQRVGMEIYISSINSLLYEDIDKISVPNHGLLATLGALLPPTAPIFDTKSAFGGTSVTDIRTEK